MPVNTELLDQLHSWYGPWDQVRAVVTGLGVSGFAAADTLVELGATVVVVDGQDSEENRAKADTLRIVGVQQVLLGEAHAQSLPQIGGEQPNLLVTSPGWRPDQPLLAAAAAARLPIFSDVELAWRVQDKWASAPDPAERAPLPKWLGLTGTNGKTTTVTMVESMLLAAGQRAIACGNVGVPVLDAIRNPAKFQVLALELSSFQLHWSQSLSFDAAAVLNLAQDHVDWHGSYEQYVAAKAKIFHNAKLACVYNADQPATMTLVEEAEVIEGCRAIGFTTSTPGLSMLGVVDDMLVDRAFLDNRRHQALELARFDDFTVPAAAHMVANALAAAALVRAIGIAPEAVRDGLSNYAPGEHRMQLVAKASDVLWVNDSKATNPHAAQASLRGFKDIVWIAGGLSKGVDYHQLIQDNAARLRNVILIGTDTAGLKAALQEHAPTVPVTEVQQEVAAYPHKNDHGRAVMAAAVAEADKLATADVTVLLAPAAASMDQFTSYATRGEAFIDAVAALMQDKGF